MEYVKINNGITMPQLGLGTFQSNDPRLKSIADKYDKTARQVALRYQLQCGVVVIPKSVHRERLQENIAVFDFSLTDEEMQVLRSFDKNTPLIGNPQNPDLVEFSTKW